jgi:hypothetical protein
MTEPDWLSRRTPPPPEELATAIREALRARNITSDAPSSMELLETAQSLLKKVLETECEAREAALDLLTADALVTYALEVGNDDPKQSGDFPERALETLASERWRL